MQVSFDPALSPPFMQKDRPRPCFVLKGPGLPEPKDPLWSKLKAIPGCVRAGGNRQAPEGTIILPAHPLAAQALLRLLPRAAGNGVEWTEHADLAADVVSKRPATKKFILERTDADFAFGDGLSKPLRPLRVHQKQALGAIRAQAFTALLADDMGLGKTAVAIEAFKLWCVHEQNPQLLLPKPPRLLVLCPVSVKWNWRNELLAQGVDEQQILVIDGPPKKRADLFVLVPHKQVIVINYDLLRNLSERHMAAIEAHVKDAFLICDESHYIKDRSSKRTQIVRDLRPAARLLLTGTPIRNNAVDLYTQISMLMEVWSNWNEFEDRYLVYGEMTLPNGKKKRHVVAIKNEKELNAIVECYQIRRLKSEVANLPPKVRRRHGLELDEHTALVYAAMKRFWLYTFGDLPDDEDVFSERARSALEQAMRLEQIAQGFVGGLPEEVTERVASVLRECRAVSLKGRPKELVFPGSTKLTWTLDYLEDLLVAGRPAVVWSRFNAPLYWFFQELERLGKKPVLMVGNLTSTQKQEVVEGFQAGRYDVLLGQVKMAEGFTLVRSSDVIMFGRDWSPAVNTQAEDRCHRIGQLGTVNVELPVVLETCEVYLERRLALKEGSAATILAVRTMRELKDLIGA